MWSNRDMAVIPWLPDLGTHQDSFQAQGMEKSPSKIIRLLSARERTGLKSSCTRSGWLREGVLVSNSALAAAGAWNPRRLQNMTLAIGPGTPAACIMSSELSGRGSDTEGRGNDLTPSNDNYHSEDSDPESIIYGNVRVYHEGNEFEDEEGERYAENETNSPIDDEVAPFVGVGRESVVETQLDGNTSDDYRREAENEIVRQLAARSIEDSNENGEHEFEGSGRNRRTLLREDSDSANNQMSDDDDENESYVASNESVGETSSGGVNDRRPSSRERQTDRVLGYLHTHILRQHVRREQSQPQRFSSATLAHERELRQRPSVEEREIASSMIHGGCINTACWLDCGWRISTVSHENSHPRGRFYGGEFATSSSYSSNAYSSHYGHEYSRNSGVSVFTSPSEYPTQLITSGDDRLVKFWDVSSSMGSTSPLPGGSTTLTPFSSVRLPNVPTSEVLTQWRDQVCPKCDDTHESHSNRNNGRYLPGIVHPLVTLSTGHRGNVFHATPVPLTPGKVATCAADGYMRLIDVEINSIPSPNSTSSTSNRGASSIIVVSPDYSNDTAEFGTNRFHHSMCFSHQFLSTNVGVVCSERGLLHFDLRLPAGSQKRGSLVEELTICKACCPWSFGGSKDADADSESVYIFAGGSGIDVALYDLRMTGRPSSQAVQRYRPRPLMRKSSVSVSGIDVSKDSRELLVSYESDQCYTFPVFADSTAAGPTIENLNASIDASAEGKPVSELAHFGGHLNRLTFLKMAKYAGPDDEYICTGSDSGHAWIYDKRSGAVVSFLRADNCTCNGILPHPRLPYFVTYGIDSTAKLWRATVPVGNIDDSDIGRYSFSRSKTYQKSNVLDKWKGSRRRNQVDLDNEDISFFPDETPMGDVMGESASQGFMGMLFARASSSNEKQFIGNDLANLSDEVSKNYFLCARSASYDEETPVKSGLIGFKRRMSLMKLIHQAEKLGLQWNRNGNGLLSFKDHLIGKSDGCTIYGAELADLIPDKPSDWIPFHSLMATPPLRFGMKFNKCYKHVKYDLYADRSIHPVIRARFDGASSFQNRDELACSDKDDCKIPSRDGDKKFLVYNSARAWDILYSTVSILKEAGNSSLKQSLSCQAARFFDKAIVYCSLAYHEFPVGTNLFLVQHQVAISENSGYECYWTPLLKALIQIRLNMSLCCTKSEVDDIKAAISQAKLCLKELKPFVAEKGTVLMGKNLKQTRLEEPSSTYMEATKLQSKAFFRLGSASLLLGNFDDAIDSFERSIDSTTKSSLELKPEQIVLKKLHEAKLARRQKKKRERKKFKFMFDDKKELSQDGAEESKL